jgi:hypothetical protein
MRFVRRLAWLALALAPGCAADYPDGKFPCENVEKCPGDDVFHACSVGPGHSDKRCYKSESIQAESRDASMDAMPTAGSTEPMRDGSAQAGSSGSDSMTGPAMDGGTDAGDRNQPKPESGAGGESGRNVGPSSGMSGSSTRSSSDPVDDAGGRDDLDAGPEPNCGPGTIRCSDGTCGRTRWDFEDGVVEGLSVYAYPPREGARAVASLTSSPTLNSASKRAYQVDIDMPATDGENHIYFNVWVCQPPARADFSGLTPYLQYYIEGMAFPPNSSGDVVLLGGGGDGLNLDLRRIPGNVLGTYSWFLVAHPDGYASVRSDVHGFGIRLTVPRGTAWTGVVTIEDVRADQSLEELLGGGAFPAPATISTYR